MGNELLLAHNHKNVCIKGPSVFGRARARDEPPRLVLLLKHDGSHHATRGAVHPRRLNHFKNLVFATFTCALHITSPVSSASSFKLNMKVEIGLVTINELLLARLESACLVRGAPPLTKQRTSTALSVLKRGKPLTKFASWCPVFAAANTSCGTSANSFTPKCTPNSRPWFRG